MLLAQMFIYYKHFITFVLWLVASASSVCQSAKVSSAFVTFVLWLVASASSVSPSAKVVSELSNSNSNLVTELPSANVVSTENVSLSVLYYFSDNSCLLLQSS